jgi:predicted small lipoprotein YifL
VNIIMKKTISIMAAVLMLMAFAACGNKNDLPNTSPTDVSGPTATPDNGVLPDPQPVSELSICGIPVVTNSQPTGLLYKGSDYKDGVLTLDNMAILADYGSSNAIYFVGELEIVIHGESTIEAMNGMSAIAGVEAEDGTQANLTISGDGRLTVSAAGAYGISCSGTITVNGGTLEISGEEAAVERGAESLTLENGLTVIEDTGVRIVVGPAE